MENDNEPVRVERIRTLVRNRCCSHIFLLICRSLDAMISRRFADSGGLDAVGIDEEVNTSGQFVGIAEMVGPVDFNKTAEYWQQDKWLGCFPVKWHIVKDVPKSALRHITLENNDNKPVTNSRDAQEVNLEQGIQILKIFKGHSSKTCILDDFEFYESRQKVMQEKKAKHKPLQKQVLGQPIVADATDNSVKAAVDKQALEKSVNAAIIEESSVSTTAY